MKIAVITPTALNTLDGTSLYFRSVLPRIPAESLCWIAAGGNTTSVPDWMPRCSRIIIPSPLFTERAGRISNSGFARRMRNRLVYRGYVDHAVEQSIRFLQEQKPDKLWVAASGHILPLAIKLRMMTGLPVHVTICEHIERRPPFEAEVLRGAARQLLKGAASGDFASGALLRYYRQLTGEFPNATTVLPGLPDVPPKPQCCSGIESIGCVGPFVSESGFPTLLRALTEINSTRDAERRVLLHVYAETMPHVFKAGYADVRRHPVPSVDTIAAVLQSHDLLYVPSGLTEETALFNRNELSWQLPLYASSQVPVLAHGTENSLNAEFVTGNGIGLAVSTQDPDELAAMLNGYGGNLEARQTASARCRELYDELLSADRVWQALEPYITGGKQGKN